MHGPIKRVWLATTLYCGVGLLFAVLMVQVLVGDLQTNLALGVGPVGISIASFLSSAMASRFTEGRSAREGIAAAVMLGLAQYVPLFAPVETPSLGQTVSTLALAFAAALLGAKLGAKSASWIPMGPMSRVLWAAFILIGIFVLHLWLLNSVVWAIDTWAPVNLLINVIGVAAVALSPSLAGFILQLTSDEMVESHLRSAILTIGFVGIGTSIWLYGFGAILVVNGAVIVGILIHTVALPGVLVARRSRHWQVQATKVPQAFVASE